MVVVTAQFSDEEPVELEDCQTVGAVMARYAKIREKFASEISVEVSEGAGRLPIADPAPANVVISFVEYEDDIGTCKQNLRLHAALEDTETCTRIIDAAKRHHSGLRAIEEMMEESLKSDEDLQLVSVLLSVGVPAIRIVALSAREGNNEVLGRLLDANASIDVHDPEGDTALITAAFHGKLETVQFLMEREADIHRTNKYSDTALSLASRRGCAAVVKCLVDAQCDVNVTDEDGFTPLVLASHHGHADLVSYFLAEGAAVDHTDKRGFTALFHAVGECKAGQDITRLLLAGLANVNYVVPATRESCLLRATRYADAPVVEMLLAGKADSNLSNEKGETPYTVAQRKGHDSILELLRQDGS